MSFYERDNHLEHPRTETSDGASATLGGTTHGSRSGRAAQPVRTTVRRLSAAYRKEGAAALAHGNRGRKPIQSISEEVRSQVVELASTTYVGCNYQHLRDLLAERDGIQLSRTSVRRIRLPAGIASPRKQRRRQHRRRRVRYAASGDAGADRWQSTCLARGARPLVVFACRHR